MTDSPTSASNQKPLPYQKGSPEYRAMHTQLGLLAMSVIINVIGFSIIFPIAPYIVQHALGPGTNPNNPDIVKIAGWLSSVYALMQFFFAPIWGRLSDKIGRRPILMASLAGDVIFYTMFGFSHSLPMLFASRILAGIFSSGSLAVAQAYAADVTTPEHRAAGLGMIGASFGVGFVFGPALGGLLGSHNLSLPLFVSAGLALTNLVFIKFWLPEPTRPPQENNSQAAPAPASGRIASMAKAMKSELWYLFLLTFLVTLSFAFLEGTFNGYLMQHFHYTKQSSTVQQGLVFTYLGVILVLVQGGAIRPLVKRFGEAPLVIAGIGLMAIGFALFPLANNLAILMLGPLLPITIGNGLNTPALRALISRKSAVTAQGGSLGLSASFDSLARAIGPGTASWMYAQFGQRVPYLGAAVIMAIAWLFAFTKRRQLAATIDAPSSTLGVSH